MLNVIKDLNMSFSSPIGFEVKWHSSRSDTIKTDLCIVGSQIILSTILAIKNNNHTQEYKICVENPFFLKGKTTGQTSNQFHYYQIKLQ